MNEPGALTHRVDYRRLATRQGRVSGDVELSDLPRVMAEMADAACRDKSVAVDLGFDEDAQRRVYVKGTIETTLRLECQRCLRLFDAPMHVDVRGVVVANDDAAANVPREDEPVLADGDMLDLHELVADELLLAMPEVARCSAPECLMQFADNDTPAEKTTDKKTTNPFAVLDQLKRHD